MKALSSWASAIVIGCHLVLTLSVRSAVIVTEPRELPASDTSLEGQEVVVRGTTLTVSGSHTFRSLALEGGAVLTHPPASSGQAERAVRLTITGDCTVDASSRLDASGMGYSEAESPGAGRRGDWSGSGGAYGGRGGPGSANAASTAGDPFGSILAPDSWGGPGANGSTPAFAAGGGLIHVEVVGTLTLEGAVRADGAAGLVNNQGGGAGGTVYLRAGTWRGGGVISANGAPGEWVDGGGGGGGRIAVYYERREFVGRITAHGQGGASFGGAGTIYLAQGNGPGEVLIDNASRGGWTPITTPKAFDLRLSGEAVVQASEPLALGQLVLEGNALLTHPTGSTGLVVRTTGDVIIGSTAAINVDGRGYPWGETRGPGAGVRNDWAGSGAGHGGWGGRAVTGGDFGKAYGSILEPTDLGSQGGDSNSGPGVAGGGAIRLITGGRLQVDGRLSADGLASGVNNSGGGSGGSIWVTAGALSGSGVISANGGAGEWVDGGGGGGGRIALYYGAGDSPDRVSATGGGGSQRGGAGTVYRKKSGESTGQVVIGNGGVSGNLTPIRSPEAFRLLIADKAAAYAESALTLDRLDILAESTLMHLTGQTNLDVTVRGDLVVAAGGVMTADGKGYPVGEQRGPGTGAQLDWAGSGGGHGGLGGIGATGIAGGRHYGSILQPTALGSQGGNSPSGAGAPGGGAIRLRVGGVLTVDGRLTAEGIGASINNAGGGAGGSLWIDAGELAGAGVISVNGGPGEWVDGGGGGGGRVALYLANNVFRGTLVAFGGGGHQRGGAGTIYHRRAGSAVGEVQVHNGGAWGQYTPISSPEAFRLTLVEMAQAYPVEPLTLTSLEVGTNAILTHLTGQPNCQVHVLENLVVRENGAIHADGRGYPVDADLGPGAGSRKDWGGGGAGHGGQGGRGGSGALGGVVYGSYSEPVTAGSRGGAGDGGAGGAGGGVLRLIVDRTLTVQGRLSADGLPGAANNSGGGSGGSIYVTADTLEGSGVISASGGPGEWVDGGGGSGGRIALHLRNRTYAGTIRAQGGGGSALGGAGTIFTKLGTEPGGELVLNNGADGAALSPIDVNPNERLVLAGGATVYPVATLRVAGLRLEPGSTLTHTNGQNGLQVVVEGDLTVEAGAAITANALGYPVGDDPGPGAGEATSNSGAGGAHAGNGGNGWPGTVPGGIAYGSVIEPADFGSSGGWSGGSGNARSPGGGAIRLTVGGTLNLEGRITADGSGAWYNNQGGGAGGSIWITAGRMTGSGPISANGGAGEWVDGGGGGGGRIALHLGTNAYQGPVAARGGGGHQTGGAGTIYTRLAAETAGTVWIDNGGTWGAYTPLSSPEPYHLFLTNRARAYADDPIVLGSLTTFPETVISHRPDQAGFRAVVLGDARIAGAIDANGQGYPVAGGAGPGAGSQRDWSGGGAGHGGAGGPGATGAPGGVAYGSAKEPALPGSQGGSGNGGPGGAGGGVVRLIAGRTLTVDGTITANGLNGTANNSGGGSGGSILLGALRLEGSGRIAADGGAGEWVDGGGGAGGRIAVYRTETSFGGTLSAKGAGGAAQAEDGTIFQDAVPMVIWLSPAEGWIHDVVDLQAAMFTDRPGPVTAEFSVWQSGVGRVLGSQTQELVGKVSWDTRTEADGRYELRVVVRDTGGRVLGEDRRLVNVNNSAVWHEGRLASSETWSAGRVHLVRGDLSIPSGVTLSLEPGVVVKFLPDTRLILHGGGTLDASGTSAQPIVLTSFLDDAVAGDTNLDGDETAPRPGVWRLVLNASGNLGINDRTQLKYYSRTYGGTLTGSETWTGDSLREITETVVVPSGATLRIEAGAIVKFGPGQGLDVKSGAGLVVAGSRPQPVVLTSIRDDGFGGDSNDDGTRTRAEAGDWRSVRFEDGASGTIDHAVIRFGGNSVGNPWGAGGVLEALGGPLEVRNSVISDALKDGAFCYGRTRFENTLVLRCDRGLTAVGEMEVIHCTIDACRIGLLEHVGQLNVRNSIVSSSIDAGIEHDLGSGVPVVSYCNVWNPQAGRGNYSGVTDRTGRDGNVSVEPRYKDVEADDYRLSFGSPGIDAANGAVGPATDLAGSPRYDDPRTGNTGVASANGGIPDMGSFEFVESAPSNLDLVVTGVVGPDQAVAGSIVEVRWTILNRGGAPFSGPWHDALYLEDLATGRRLYVSEVLVGNGTTVGAGQSMSLSAEVRVPGGSSADYRWLVAANSRGDVFEGANAANNEAASEGATALTIPSIPLDAGGVSASFAVQEESHWFQCQAPAGKDVRIDLDLGPASGVTEIYVGRGFMPTGETFDVRQREFGAADTSAVASGAGSPTGPGNSNTFYVLVVGRVLEGTPAPFQVRASTAPFAVEAVANGPVGNSALVTLEVHGSGFATNTVFTLVREGVQRIGLRQSVRESGRAFVTFDLAGFPAGPAGLSAGLGGVAVTKGDAVEIIEGGAPDFYASLNGPGTTRAGRTTTWFVTYGNRGSVDVPLPMLRFSAPGATEIRLFDHTRNWADRFSFLAMNPAVLLPTLGPGQEVTMEVRVKAMNALTVALDVLGGHEWMADGTAFDWTSLPAPTGVNPTKWAETLGTLPVRLGRTVADYAQVLLKDLAEIAADPMRYSYLANVDGGWLFGSEPDDFGTEIPIIEIPPEEEDPPGAAPALHAAPAKIPGDGIRKTWWVVITIEDYALRRATGSGAKDLPGTAVDARDLNQYMYRDLRVPQEQTGGGHDAPNDGAGWTRNFILEELQKFKGKVDADDNLVIVYSGHGGRTQNGTGYLCANGGGSISPTAFTKAIDQVGAGTTYFVNDSCHAEAFNEAVDPSNTTFVGLGATKADRTSRDTAHGGELISNLKNNLRKCNSLGKSFELTEQHVSNKYKDADPPRRRQHPVLTNPTGASLEGKPWNDPAGFEQEFRRRLNNLPYHRWGEAILGIVGSVDPNDKYALAGAGPQRWVQPTQVLPFEVVFENKTNAAAAAQEVLVVDDLDANLDWSTFELKGIAFNDAKIAVPPGLQRFTATTRVGTDPNEVVVDVSFNPVTGRITWLMRSIDAATGDLPEDPFAGFLPPNDPSHRGEGSLSYTVRPNAGLADGTMLTNRATIIFDPTYGANPPIVTPWVTNTIDGLPPVSQVAPLPATAIGEVPVQWSGDDAPGGSGIASFDIYVSADDGPYLPWQLATTERMARFAGEPGTTYRFFSIARDAAGNTEPEPARADATVAIGGGSVGPVKIELEGVHIRVTFEGILQSAPTVAGPWTDVVGAINPHQVFPSGTVRFYRARR